MLRHVTRHRLILYHLGRLKLVLVLLWLVHNLRLLELDLHWSRRSKDRCLRLLKELLLHLVRLLRHWWSHSSMRVERKWLLALLMRVGLLRWSEWSEVYHLLLLLLLLSLRFDSWSLSALSELRVRLYLISMLVLQFVFFSLSLIENSLVVTWRPRRLVILYSRLIHSELLKRLRRLVEVRCFIELVEVLVLVLKYVTRLNLDSLVNSLSLLKLRLSLLLFGLSLLRHLLLVVVLVLDLGPNSSFGAFCRLGSCDRLLSLLLDWRCLSRLDRNRNRGWHSLKYMLLGVRYSRFLNLRGCFLWSTDLTGRQLRNLNNSLRVFKSCSFLESTVLCNVFWFRRRHIVRRQDHSSSTFGIHLVE